MSKCRICNQGVPRYTPELKASGWSSPKDMKCPVCDTFHDGTTGKTTKQYLIDDEQAKNERLNKRHANVPMDYLYTVDYWTPPGVKV